MKYYVRKHDTQEKSVSRSVEIFSLVENLNLQPIIISVVIVVEYIYLCGQQDNAASNCMTLVDDFDAPMEKHINIKVYNI